MAVTSKNLHSGQHVRPRGSPLYARAHAAAYGMTLLLAAIAVYAVVGMLFDWGRVVIDDVRYGRPRTFQIDGFVGHEEAAGMPTHFIAVNLDRQVVVFELPGGDPAKVHALQGPYLFGAKEHLTPVTLELHDVDGDGQNDLLLTVRQEQIVYLNRDGTFRLPTAEEQSRLKSSIDS